MVNAIRVMFISLIMAALLVKTSMAGNILYGTARIKPDSTANYLCHKESETFPREKYTFHIEAYNLKYDGNIPLQNRVKDLGFFTLWINANLKLISFNKNTGIYKFNLQLNGGDFLEYNWRSGRMKEEGNLLETGGKPLIGGGSLKLANGTQPDFIIEGKFEYINGKSQWISFNRNKYFDLEVENRYLCKSFGLKLLQELPIIVST